MPQKRPNLKPLPVGSYEDAFRRPVSIQHLKDIVSCICITTEAPKESLDVVNVTDVIMDDAKNASEIAVAYCKKLAERPEAHTMRIEKDGAYQWYTMVIVCMLTATAADLAVPSMQIVDKTYEPVMGIRWGHSFVTYFEEEKRKTVDAYDVLTEARLRHMIAQPYANST